MTRSCLRLIAKAVALRSILEDALKMNGGGMSYYSKYLPLTPSSGLLLVKNGEMGRSPSVLEFGAEKLDRLLHPSPCRYPAGPNPPPINPLSLQCYQPLALEVNGGM